MKRFLQVLMLIAALAVPWVTQAQQTLTVNDGTALNQYVPLYGYYADMSSYADVQFIIPQSQLASMAGKSITDLKFYANYNQNFGAATWDIYIGETNQTAMTAIANYSSSCSLVYSGNLAISSNELAIQLGNEYVYGGSNLLVVFHKTHLGTCSSSSSDKFYGVSAESGASGYFNNSYYAQSFLPKVTFTYGEPVSCHKPTGVTASNITATSANVSWTPGDSTQSMFQYAYGTVNDIDSMLPMDTWLTSVTINNLEPNTTYYVYAKAICGFDPRTYEPDESNWSAVCTFTTPCAVVTLPYREDFESLQADAVAPCWDNSMSSSSRLASSPQYLWGVYSYGGNKMIRMYNYMVNAGSAVINTPQIDLPANGSYQLKFDYTHTASSGDFLVKVSTDGGSTFTTIATLTNNSGSNTSNTDPGIFTPVTYDLSAFAGNTITIQFWNNADYGSGAIFVDNIVVRETPSCLEPTDVTASNITATSANVSWTPGDPTQSMFQYAYGTVNDIDSMLPMDTWLTSVTINNLEPSTTYYVYAKAICGFNPRTYEPDESEWSAVCTFTTPCAAQTLPYAEDFNSYATGSTASISPCWTKGTNNTTAYPYPYSSVNIDGTNCLYFYGYHTSTASSCKYSYAALPLMDTSISNLMMTFQTKRYNSTSSSYTSYLVVGVMADPADISTFVGYDTIDLTLEPGGSVHDIEIVFNNYTGIEGNIAFLCPDVVPSTATGTTGTNYVYLDNVVVDLIPSCWTVTDLAVVENSATINSIDISWTERNAAATQWNVGYVANGDTEITNVIVNSNPATISGLAANTAYTFYVSPICAAGDTANAKSVQCRTVCPSSLSAPYFENFEGYTNISTSYYYPSTAEGYPNLMPACWPASVMYASASSSGSSAPQFFMTNSSSYANGGTVLALRGYSTTKPAVLALPMLINPVNTLQIEFDYRQYSSSYGTLQLGVMTDPSDTTSFVALETLPRTVTYAHVSHDFGMDANLPAGDLYVALRHIQGSTSASYVSYVDNLSLTVAPTCKNPVDVAIDTTTETSATLSWEMPLSFTAASYTVAYGAGNFDAEDNSTWLGSVSTSTMNATLTGLQAGTCYQAAVRGECSATEVSNWSNTITFFTECPASAFVVDASNSMVEGFDNTEVNPCWTIIYADPANATINPVITTSLDGSNGNCLRFASYSRVTSGEYHQYAISPEFASADLMNLSFRAAFYGEDDSLWCGISSTTNDLSAFTWVAIPHVASWETFEAALPANTKYLAFQYYGDFAYYAYVDDVVISALPKYTVAANVNDTVMGTVAGTTGLVYEGDTAILVAVANANYHFVNWSNGEVADTLNVIVVSDITLTANFAPDTFAIAVAVNDTTMGTVAGAGRFAYLASDTLTATATTGYHFVSWNDGDTNAIRVITVIADTTYTANFAINQYTVAVAANDSVMGTVTGAGVYNHNATATLTATANTGYHFVSWNDGDTNTTRVITVIADTAFTATFAANQYTIAAVAAPAWMGIITGTGIYSYGDTATLTAVAADSAMYEFAGWADGDTNITRQVVVTSDASYTANFDFQEITINLTINDTALGTTNPLPGTYTFHVGDTMQGEAIPAEHCHFVNWETFWNGESIYDDDAIISTYVFDSMSAGYTLDIVCTFASDARHTVSVYAIDTLGHVGLGGTVTGGGLYYQGEQVTLTATADEDYTFLGWIDFMGEPVSTETSYTFTMVGFDVDYYALFQSNFEDTNTYYTILAMAVSSEDEEIAGGDVTGTGSYLAGTQVTLTATAWEGYTFSGWFTTTDGEDIQQVSDQSEYTFTVTSDMIFMALFVNGESTEAYLQVNADENMGVVYINNEIVDDNNYEGEIGDQVELKAVAKNGYEFSGWSNGDTAATITITLNQYLTVLTANFATIQSISSVETAKYTVYSVDNNIVVKGAEQQPVYVYDAIGRLVAKASNADVEQTFAMSHSGVYLVKVANSAAKRVVVR